MVGEDKVHFFDISSTLPDSKPWGPNPVRTRAVLNYKKIPYTQSYIPMQEIEPLIKSLQVAPNPKPAPLAYTLPAITHKPSLSAVHPASATITGTWPTAEHLEATFPAPQYASIYPTSASRPLALAVSRILEDATKRVRFIVAHKVVLNLDDKGKEHMRRTRQEIWGKPLEELALKGEELKDAWANVERELGVFAEMLACSAGRGPFFEGDRVGFADLMVLAWLNWILTADETDFERVVSLKDGELRRLWEAGKQWVYGQGEEVEYEVPK